MPGLICCVCATHLLKLPSGPLRRGNQNGALLYQAESVSIPGYTNYREIACTVCLSAGSVYVNMGKSNACPTGHSALQTGYWAGSHYTHRGSSATGVCLSNSPQNPSTYSDGQANSALTYFTEYETYLGAGGADMRFRNLDQYEVSRRQLEVLANPRISRADDPLRCCRWRARCASGQPALPTSC